MNLERLAPDITTSVSRTSLDMPIRDFEDFREAFEAMLACTNDLVVITREAIANADFYKDIVCFDGEAIFPNEQDKGKRWDVMHPMGHGIVEDIYSARPHHHEWVLLSSSPSDMSTVAISEANFLQHIEPLFASRMDGIAQLEIREDEKEYTNFKTHDIKEGLDLFLNTEKTITRHTLNVLLWYLGHLCRRGPRDKTLIRDIRTFQLAAMKQEPHGEANWHDVGLAHVKDDILHFGQVGVDLSCSRQEGMGLKRLFALDVEKFRARLELIISLLKQREQ